MTQTQLHTLNLALKRVSGKVTDLKRELSQYRDYAEKNFEEHDAEGQKAISDMKDTIQVLGATRAKISNLRKQIVLMQ